MTTVHIGALLAALGAVPLYPPVYQMNLSTIIMPCNETGLTDPSSTKGWGVVDFGTTE